ncbi:MAG: DUF3857 and transglutaminase domain-containing protein [Chitinophagaceae bacterium]
MQNYLLRHAINNLVLPLLASALTLPAVAQSSMYSLASVPDVVKTNADVILHSEKINLEIESLDKLVYTVHKVYTILNESGKQALTFYEFSSSLQTLSDAQIRVYDANGKQTARYKKKDMTTESYGEGLINDGYVTWMKVLASNYPVTIEVEYEKKIKGTFFIPDYYFMSSRMGIVASDYTIKAPADLQLRFKNVLTGIEPVVSTEGNSKLYRWAVNSLPPFEYEEGSAATEYIPHVKVTANQISLDGYKGDFSSWLNFGRWYFDLCAGLDKLSPEREEFFRNLVKDVTDNREKVRLIYKYLQDNFRYVDIQLGVGGYRPLPASFTDKQKYGDCKGLSNFMKAALNAVGIQSNLCIINRNSNGVPADPAYPKNSFNHVILCVPLVKDSVWLECTSTTAEFGHLDISTENRNALVVNNNGGYLIPTPLSSYTSNYLGSYTRITMDDDLSALLETKYSTYGEYSEIMSDISKNNRDDQKKILVSYLGYKQPDDFVFERSGKQESSLKMAIGKVHEFTSGDKSFINHRLQKMLQGKLPKAENRKQDFYFSFPFEKRDTTLFVLPAGYSVEVLPKTKKLVSPYSSYEVSYRSDTTTGSIEVVTRLILRQHRIPAADYPLVKKFFDDVVADQTQKLVIRKTDTGKKAF